MPYPQPIYETRSNDTVRRGWFDGVCQHAISFVDFCSAVSKAIDETRGQTEIVLALRGAGWADKGRALIVALNAEGKWSEEVALNSSANFVRRTGYPPMQIASSTNGNGAVHPTGAGHGMNEDSGIPMSSRIEHGTGQTAQDIAAVSRAEHVASAGISGVHRRSPMRVEPDQAGTGHAGEPYTLRWRGHAEIDVAETRLKSRAGSRGCRFAGSEASLRQKRRNEQENASGDSSDHSHSGWYSTPVFSIAACDRVPEVAVTVPVVAAPGVRRHLAKSLHLFTV